MVLIDRRSGPSEASHFSKVGCKGPWVVGVRVAVAVERVDARGTAVMVLTAAFGGKKSSRKSIPSPSKRDRSRGGGPSEKRKQRETRALGVSDVWSDIE